MLVLTRAEGECLAFKVGGEVFTVKVQKTSGRHSTLAIDAPKDVTVLRGELLTTGGPDDPAWRRP